MDTARAAPSGSLHRDGMVEAIAFAAERLLVSPEWRDAADEVLARLGQAADVSRAYIVRNTEDGRGRLTSNWLAEWTQPGVLRVMDDPDFRSALWEESGFGRWARLLGSGEVVQGAIAAFKVQDTAGKVTLAPAWLSRNMYQADPALIANGLVFGFGSGADTTQATAELGLPYNTAANRVANSSHATLYALDAQTGDELWSSGDQITSFNHFSGLSVANGRVYIGTYDGTLYCFAVGASAMSAGRDR